MLTYDHGFRSFKVGLWFNGVTILIWYDALHVYCLWVMKLAVLPLVLNYKTVTLTFYLLIGCYPLVLKYRAVTFTLTSNFLFINSGTTTPKADLQSHQST